MKKYIPILIVLLVLMVAYNPANAQCAMCSGQVESATSAGSSVALGINKGVLYIFMMPYLIMGTIGYFWWKARKKTAAETNIQ